MRRLEKIFLSVFIYQDTRSVFVEAGAGGGEADAGGEVLDGIVGVEVGRDGRLDAESLGDEIGGNAAIAESAGGQAAGEVPAVRPEVALQHRGYHIVVAGIDGRVPEDDDRGHFARECGVKEKESGGVGQAKSGSHGS